MIRLFCKLKRITFHYFIFTLSLSFRKLPRCFFWYSPMFRTYQPSYFPQQAASLPHPAALFLLCPDLFSPCACPSFITSKRYLNTQLSRFLHKSIPYITRAYARKNKGYNISTPLSASHESHHSTPFTHSHQRHKSKIWPSARLSKTNEFEKTSEPIARH